ncbi:YwgA family protein [Salipaludibacillus sp. HK11]|uniref:YwgA family protein n=1 Tax=Salipaludibacillus sp. HK11 TaxID=3394320 RepID=UPI0039FD95EC
MLHEHGKLLALLKQTGEIVGRKKLQKMVYIAQKMNLPFHEKYQFHMFGPYSEELSLRMEEVCQLEFVSEVKEKKSGYQQYRYQLSEKGNNFLEMVASDFPDATAMLSDMNERSAKFLELVSTVLYFEDFSREEVTNKVFTLKAKQNYTEQDMDEAYNYIARLQKTAI